MQRKCHIMKKKLNGIVMVIEYLLGLFQVLCGYEKDI